MIPPPLIHLARVDSTQAFLKRHPELGWALVLADAQSAGRGRGANRWESAPGAGLWLSAVLPHPALEPGRVLQQAMAVVAALLDPPGGRLGLKWPNDLVAWRGDRLVKLGGILGELSGDRMILGLGVNLRAAPLLEGRAFPAACLADLGLSWPDPAVLARRIGEAWWELDRTTISPAFRWPAPGEPIRWEDGEGLCQGWEPDGRLRVAGPGGIQRLCSAEVRGMSEGAPLGGGG